MVIRWCHKVSPSWGDGCIINEVCRYPFVRTCVCVYEKTTITTGWLVLRLDSKTLVLSFLLTDQSLRSASLCLSFHGHCDLLSDTVEYWKFQEQGKAKITPERIQILESIGFEWDPQKVAWQRMYEQLQDFVRQHGHAKVPKGFVHNPELANWVRNQRLEHCNGRMTPERIALLDKLGFVWSQSNKSTGASKKNAVGQDA